MFRKNNEKKLSEAERGQIIGLLEAGFSQVEVANQLGVSRRTVQRWENRYDKTNSVKRKQGSGRSKKNALSRGQCNFQLGTRESNNHSQSN